MKKSIILFVIFTASLFSCSKSDDGEIAQSNIVGKWRTISAKQNELPVSLSTCFKSGYIEFLSIDNLCIIDSGEDDLKGTNCIHTISNGTYTFIDNVLTFKKGEYESRSRISELTTTNFKTTTYYVKEGTYIDVYPEKEQITYTVEKIN
jgi:hypothetical protein